MSRVYFKNFIMLLLYRIFTKIINCANKTGKKKIYINFFFILYPFLPNYRNNYFITILVF